MTFTGYKITLVFLIYQLWEIGFVTRLNGAQNPKANSLMFGRKEWDFFFGFFLVKAVYNQDVLVEHSLAQARCSIHTDWPEAEFSILGAMDVLFASGAHSHCISLTSVGIFRWKEFHICRVFLYFESFSPAAGVFEQKTTWKATCTQSMVCDLIMQILSSSMWVQAESCRKRVLLQASNKDTISIHSQSSLLKCFCKCSIHGVGMCFVGG